MTMPRIQEQSCPHLSSASGTAVVNRESLLLPIATSTVGKGTEVETVRVDLSWTILNRAGSHRSGDLDWPKGTRPLFLAPTAQRSIPLNSGQTESLPKTLDQRNGFTVLSRPGVDALEDGLLILGSD